MSSSGYKEMFYKPGDERAVLSYCFKDIDYFYSMTSKISEEDFLDDSHQLLFVILKELANSGVNKFDLSMVVNKSQSLDVLELIGGVGYLQSVVNMPISDENFEIYLENVMESSIKYKTYSSLQKHLSFIEKNAQTGKNSSDLISGIENNILDLSSNSLLNEDPKVFGDDIDKFIESRKDKKTVMTGISTGYPVLDKQIDGMIPGTLMVVAARKKMGKSTFLTNIGLYNAYIARVPTLYIDTEMTYVEWQTRALAVITGIKERGIKHGGWNKVQLDKLNKAKELLKKGKIFHKYMPGYSVDKIVSLCKKYKVKENIGLIIFDYLKEPDLSTVGEGRKEYQILGDVTTKLKDLSGILDVPALTAVQLNRQNNIADSDRIARYGDIVSYWGLRTEDEKKAGGAECGQYKLVIKDTRRGGSTPEEGIGYRFHKTRLTIHEVPAHDQYFMQDVGEVTNYNDFDEDVYKNRYIVEDELE
jgi:replicative DNA helicase